jgi:hypothetical protein
MTDQVESTQLTKDEAARFARLFSNTPLVALPDGGMKQAALRPRTVSDVLTTVENIIDYLKYEMAVREEITEAKDKIEADIGAAGRLFAKIALAASESTTVSAREVLKAVKAAVQIRHEFTAADVVEIAENHGIDLSAK